MRLMTYNVLKGGQAFPGDNRFAQLLQVLQEAAPDVLVLNECNGFEASNDAALRQLAFSLGMEARLARARSGYHVAVLVRQAKFLQWHALADGFAHAAGCARIRWGREELLVIGTHLDPFAPEQRLHEIRALLALIDARSNCVLLGDLNSLSPSDLPELDPASWSGRYKSRHGVDGQRADTSAIAALEGAGLVDLARRAGATGYTRPTQMYWKTDVPLQRLDYLFATPDVAARLVRVWVLNTSLTQAASDHLPVLAELDFSR